MSNFPPGQAGQPGMPPKQPYQPYQPYQQAQQPSSGGSGGNTVLIILAVVGGLLVLGLGTCGIMAWMVTRSVTNMVTELSSGLNDMVAADLVSQYEEREEIASRIGVVEDYELKNKDASLFELIASRKIVIILKGEKGEGELILYQKNQEPEKVTFVFNGEEVTLDEDPPGFNANYDSDSEMWNEDEVESDSSGFGTEEFSDSNNEDPVTSETGTDDGTDGQ